MDKLPSQKEIGLPSGSAQDLGAQNNPEHAIPAKKTGCFAVGRSGAMTDQQVGSISALHEAFARNLARRLSTDLRTTAETKLVSVEQIAFGEQMQRLAEQSYLAVIEVQPLDTPILVELELATAFPIIDLLLGGDGKGEPPSRSLTEIEDLVLQGAMETICQELQAVWKDLVELRFALGARQQRAKLTKVLPPDERALAVSFELQIMERRGSLMFVFPASVSGALLRKVSEQAVVRKHQPGPDFIAAQRKRVQDCTFEVEVRLPETPVSLQFLLALRPGQVLRLGHRIDEPAQVSIGGQKWFSAKPVRARNLRGALIETDVLPAGPVPKEIL